MEIKVTGALQQLLWSQIEDHCSYAELGEDHHSLYIKLSKAKPGEKIELAEHERKELWEVCDFINETWDDEAYTNDRRLARAWRQRVVA